MHSQHITNVSSGQLTWTKHNATVHRSGSVKIAARSRSEVDEVYDDLKRKMCKFSDASSVRGFHSKFKALGSQVLTGAEPNSRAVDEKTETGIGE